jgi:hypothetical protein
MVIGTSLIPPCEIGVKLKSVDKQAEPAQEEMTDLSLEELAACQGVRPITDFDGLLGRPSRDDESADEFARKLHEWRCEGR